MLAVCGLGIAGMIVTSATHHNGAAITFGLVTAVAVICQMVATTVINEASGLPGAPVSTAGLQLEQDGARLEDAIGRLVAAGAEESAVRDLVRQAVRLGRRDVQTPPDP